MIEDRSEQDRRQHQDPNSPKRRATDKLQCPYCGHPQSRVKDGRLTANAGSFIRRRKCTSCSKFFETSETVLRPSPAP